MDSTSPGPPHPPCRISQKSQPLHIYLLYKAAMKLTLRIFTA